MPARPARFPAPAAVDPWGPAVGKAAWSSSGSLCLSGGTRNQKATQKPRKRAGENKKHYGQITVINNMDKHIALLPKTEES